jgi:class 3 adenylate cyclase
METNEPTEQQRITEQRGLATIMFTDVVGFSKLSAINEEKAYLALQRDFRMLGEEISNFGGEILNTMGDGMMVVFTSAVEAMRCALKIQQNLHTLAATSPTHGVLQHRIGLHVGDIILNGKSTMGDGVNTAARIQSIAQPDSIAMSREFHNLVFDKVQMNAKYLGPRRARNLPESIPVYEVPPILLEEKLRAADIMFTPESTSITSGATGKRAAMLGVVAAVLIAMSVAPMYLLKNSGIKNGTGSKIPEGKSTQTDIKKMGDKLGGKTVATNQTVNIPESPKVTEPSKFALNVEEISQLDTLKSQFEFEKIVEFLGKIPGIEAEDGQLLLNKYKGLASMKTWFGREMNSTSEQVPLELTIQSVASSAHTTPDGIVILANGQTSAPRQLWEWKTSTLAAMLDASFEKPPTKSIPPVDATKWISDFKSEYKVN